MLLGETTAISMSLCHQQCNSSSKRRGDMKKMLSIYHATIEFDPTSPRLCHYHTTYFLWSIIGHGIGLRIVRGWPMSTTLPPINILLLQYIIRTYHKSLSQRMAMSISSIIGNTGGRIKATTERHPRVTLRAA
jgi:hypothetical protein